MRRLSIPLIFVLLICLSFSFAEAKGHNKQKKGKHHPPSPSAIRIVSHSIEPTTIVPGGTPGESEIAMVFKVRPLGGFPQGKILKREYFIDYEVQMKPESGGAAVRTIEGRVEVEEPDRGDCKIQVWCWHHKNGKKFKKLIKCFFKKLKHWHQGIEVPVSVLWPATDDSGNYVSSQDYKVIAKAEFIRQTTIKILKKTKVITKKLGDVRKRLGKITVDAQSSSLEVAITSPADGAIIGSRTVEVQGTVSDSSATVTVNGVAAVVSGNTYSATITFAADGANQTISVQAELSGQSASAQRQVTIDTEAPVLSALSPANNSYLAASPILTGHVEDLTTITLTVQGTAVSVTNGDFSHQLSLAEGTSETVVRAEDAAGNVSEETLTYTLDTISPIVQITSPTATHTRLSTITVEGVVTEDNLAEVRVNGIVATISGTNFSAEITFSGEGNQQITAVATDLAGNTGQAESQIIADWTAPAISDLSPSDGSWTKNTVAVITGSLSEADVQVTVAGVAATVTGQTFSVQAPLPNEGENVLPIVATDLAGNTLNAELKLNRDTVQPVVNVSTLPAYTNVEILGISGTVEDASLQSFKINDVDVPVINGAFSHSLSLVEGTNEVSIIAEDSAGNTSTLSAQTILDTVVPEATLVSPSEGAFFNASPISISGTYDELHLKSIVVNGVTADIQGNSFSAQIPIWTGETNISLTIEDLAGNYKHITRIVNLDQDLPVLANITPESGLWTSSSVITVSGEIDEPNLDEITVGQFVAQITGNTFTAEVPLTTEGQINLVVNAKDLATNEASHTIVVYRDATPPVITLTTPSDGAFLASEQVLVEGTVEEANLTDFTIQGSTVVVEPDGSFSAQLTLSEGNHVITVAAVDEASNEVSSNIGIVIDVTDPVLVVTEPISPYTNLETVTVAGTIQDANISRVEVNGTTAVLQVDSFSLEVPLAEGSNSLNIVAFDMSGNSVSETKNLTRDTIAPEFLEVLPADGTMVKEPGLVISGSVNDLNLVGVRVNGADAVLTGSDFSYSAVLEFGLNAFTVVARDAAGNEKQTELSITYENVAPELQIQQPTHLSYVGNPQLTVTGLVRDSDLASVTINGTSATVTGNTFSGEVIITSSEGDWFEVIVEATDSEGNVTKRSVRVCLDATPPEVQIIQPFDGGYTTQLQLAVVGWAEDLSLDKVLVNGNEAIIDNGTFSSSVVLSEGWNTIEVSAYDKAANVNTISLQYEYRKDGDLPQITIDSPLDASLTNQGWLEVVGQVYDSAIDVVEVNDVFATVENTSYSVEIPLYEGENAVVAKATDLDGNVSSKSILVTRDSYEPILTIQSPSSGITIRDSVVSVSGLALDVHLASVTINGRLANINNEVYQGEVELNLGENTIIVTASDSANNISTHSILVTYDPDFDGPEVLITSPVDGSYIDSSSVNVEGMITGNVQSLTINGQAVNMSASSFSAVVELFEGLNTIEVLAQDDQGRETASSVSVIKDTASPFLYVFEPLDNAQVNGTEVRTYGFVDDLNLDFLEVAGQQVTVNDYGEFDTSITIGPGENTLAFRALDFAGNETLFNIIVWGTEAPQIWVNSPFNGEVVNKTPIEVVGGVVDADLTTLEINGVPAQVTNGSFTANVDLTTGINEIFVFAADVNSNEASLTVTAVLDTVAPELVVTSPASNIVVSDESVRVAGFTTDPDIYYVPLLSINTDFSPDQVYWPEVLGGSFEADVHLKANHNNIISLNSYDWAGNLTTTSIRVYRDTSAPVVVVSEPPMDAVTNATEITLVGTVQDASLKSLYVAETTATIVDDTFSVSLALNENLNEIPIYAVDEAGNDKTIVHQVTRDTTAPVITVISPMDGTNTRLFETTIRALVQDDRLASVSVNNVVVSTQEGIFEHSVSLVDGQNEIEVTSVDSVGNQTSTIIRINRSDAPSLTLLYPRDGLYTNQSKILVSGTISDTDLSSLSINGVTTEPNGYAYSGEVNLVLGANTISVEAIDDSGNVTTKTAIVYLEQTTPIVAIASPTSGFETNQDYVLVEGTFSDANLYRILVNGVLATISGNTYSASVPLFVDGTAQINVVATDKASNEATATVTGVRDATAPLITFSEIVDGLVTSDESIQVSGSVTDVHSVVSFALNGQSISLVGEAFSEEVLLDIGENSLNFLATDSLGNLRESLIYVIRDPGAPILTVASPPDGELTAASEIQVTGNVQDANLLEVTANGIEATLNGEAFTVTVPLVEGENTLSVVARDYETGVSTTEISVVRDTLPPEIGISHPYDGFTTSAESIFVSGAITDQHEITSVKLNGETVELVNNEFSYQVSLTIGTAPVVVEAEDELGNSSVVSLTVARDPGPPVLTVSTPVEEFTTEPLVFVSGTAIDIDLDYVKVNGNLAALGGGSFSAEAQLVEGLNTIQIEASDLQSNVSTEEASIILDTVSPEVYVTAPVQNSVVSSSLVEVSGLVIEDNFEQLTVNGVVTSVASGAFTTQISITTGTSSIEVAAMDKAGNEEKRYVTVTLGTGGPLQLSIDDPYDGEHINETVFDGGSGASWSIQSDLLQMRQRGGAAIVNNRIYLIGGETGLNGPTTNRNEEYDLATDTWRSRTPMPSTRTRLGVAAVDGKIYAIGGYEDSTRLTANEAYDPMSDTWEQKAPLPIASRDIKIAEVGGKLYVIGVGGSGNYEYDPSTNAWTAKAPWPNSSDSCAVAAIDGKIHVIGLRKTHDLYDVVTDTWSTLTPLTDYAWYHTAVARQRKLYVIGGSYNQYDVYDVDTDSWSKLPAPPADCTLAISTVVSENSIWVMGAKEGSYPTRTLQLAFGSDAIPVLGTFAANPLQSLTVNGLDANVNGSTFSVNVPVVEGSNEIIAIANDGSEQVIETISVVIDRIAPEVSISYPENGSTVGSSSMVVSGNVGDVNIAQVNVNGRLATISGDTFEAEVELSVGSNTIIAVASDKAGNVTSDSVEITLDEVLAPKISILVPVEGSVITSGVFIEDGSWTTKASVPTKRDRLTASAVNGKIYAIGGYGSGAQSVNEVYDPASDTWMTKSPLPFAMYSLTSSAVGKSIYVFGEEGTSVGYCHEYNTASDTWTRKTNKPTSVRYTVSVATSDGKIIVIGGLDNRTGAYSSAVEQYDVATDTWSSLTSLPTGRYNHAAALVDDRLFVFGGFEQDYSKRLDLIEYSFETHTWINRANVPEDFTYVRAIAANGKMYAFANQSTQRVYQYDPVADSWTRLPDAPLKRYNFGLTTIMNKAYFVGGYTYPSGYLDVTEEFYVGDYWISTTGSVDATGQVTATIGDKPVSLSSGEFTTQTPVSIGENTLVAKVTDDVGRVGSDRVTFYFYPSVAQSPPQLTIISPQDGSTTSESSIVVSGTANDTDLDKVYVQGRAVTIVDGAFNTTVTLEEGPNSILVEAVDLQNNRIEKQITVYLETGAPTIIVDAPQENLFTNKTQIVVRGSVIDDDLVSILVNGQAVKRIGNSYRTTLSLDEGTNVIIVRAQDASGNVSTKNVQVTRDTILPVISLVEDTVYTNETNYLVSATIDEANFASATIAGLPVTQVGQSISLSVGLASGSNEIYIKIVDKAGNVSSASLVVIQDATEPSFISISPPVNSWVNTHEILITGEVNKDTVERIEIAGKEAVISGSSFSVSNAQLASEGENVLSATIVDKAGNINETVLRYKLDSSPPFLSIRPADGSTNVVPLKDIIVKFSDVGSGVVKESLSIDLNGVEIVNQMYVGDDVAVREHSWISLPSGSNTVSVTILDTAGNTASATSEFEVSGATYPFISGLNLSQNEFCPAPNPYVDEEKRKTTARFRIATDAQVILSIISHQGVVLFSSTSEQEQGDVAIQWNGTDNNGCLLKPGEYYLQIQAINDNGNSIKDYVVVRIRF